MSLNTASINTTAINDRELYIIASGSGALISVEQKVVIYAVSASLIDVEQIVELLETGSGALISIEQITQSSLSSTALISIEQKVINPAVIDNVTRYGWDLIVYINGQNVSDQVCDQCQLTRTESAASIVSLVLLPPIGTQDVDSYQGATITIDERITTGTKRIYTGLIDVVDVDLYNEKIKIQCTDRRKEQLNTIAPSLVANIGTYNSNIFSIAKDQYDEITQRLTTVEQALDFDAYGNLTLTNWSPKAAPDITFSDSDVDYQRGPPAVQLTSRARIINQINLKFGYRYDRFYHVFRTWEWNSPIKTDRCALMSEGYTMTAKTMVQQAITSAAWKLIGNISFTEIYPSGWYTCGGVQLSWSTSEQVVSVLPAQDSSGAAIMDAGVPQTLDAFGVPIVGAGQLYKAPAQVYHTIVRAGQDFTGVFCMGATWNAYTQFSQSITETYNLTVQAQQSIDKYDLVEQDISYSMSESADSSSWTNLTSFDQTHGLQGNYFVDQDQNRTDFNAALAVAIQQARTTIRASHRDTRITLFTFTHPEVDLQHTVLIDTSTVVAKGKVYNITHNFDMNTRQASSDITLVLSHTTGSASDNGIYIPYKPTDSIDFPTSIIALGNHFGIDQSKAVDKDKWNGMVGNKWTTESGNTFKTTYPEQFIVDTPKIDPVMTDNRELTVSTTYTMDMPTDTLTIIFDGKS